MYERADSARRPRLAERYAAQMARSQRIDSQRRQRLRRRMVVRVGLAALGLCLLAGAAVWLWGGK